MFQYKLYGLQIISDIEFPQLAVLSGGGGYDVEIAAGEIPQEILREEEAGRRFSVGFEKSWLSNDTCRLFVESGSKIVYARKEGGVPAYLQTYILGWGMAMLAFQRGNLAIHCSAVADDRGAILIAGESGAGKSTITTAFLNSGYRLLADDMVWVEVVKDAETQREKAYAKPAFPYQKLCRNVAIQQGYDLKELLHIDEDKDKFLAPYRGTFSTEAVPVRGLIMLAALDTAGVKAEEVTGVKKFQVCVGNLFLRKLLKTDSYQPSIGQMCLRMAASIPIYLIVRPDGADTADEVMEKAFAIAEAMDSQSEA